MGGDHFFFRHRSYCNRLFPCENDVQHKGSFLYTKDPLIAKRFPKHRLFVKYSFSV